MLERVGLKLTKGSELRGPVVSPNVTQPAVMQRFLALGASPHETATTSTITLPALWTPPGKRRRPPWLHCSITVPTRMQEGRAVRRR